jgi:hypothetical protein
LGGPTSNGHVGVAWQYWDNWDNTWDLCWVVHNNWYPSQAGNCKAEFQYHYFATLKSGGTAYYWNGSQWRGPYKLNGFVYRK